jgi:hypothetical protein
MKHLHNEATSSSIGNNNHHLNSPSEQQPQQQPSPSSWQSTLSMTMPTTGTDTDEVVVYDLPLIQHMAAEKGIRRLSIAPDDVVHVVHTCTPYHQTRPLHDTNIKASKCSTHDTDCVVLLMAVEATTASTFPWLLSTSSTLPPDAKPTDAASPTLQLTAHDIVLVMVEKDRAYVLPPHPRQPIALVTEPDAMLYPQDVAVNQHGHIYISNTGRNSILVFGEAFQLQNTLTVLQVAHELSHLYPSNTITLAQPSGIAIGPSNEIAVCMSCHCRCIAVTLIVRPLIDIVGDYRNNRVVLLDGETHVCYLTIQVTLPDSIAIDALGNIYVVCCLCTTHTHTLSLTLRESIINRPHWCHPSCTRSMCSMRVANALLANHRS